MEAKVIMILGVSKAAQAMAQKMAEQGNSLVLAFPAKHQQLQAQYKELEPMIAEKGASSMVVPLQGVESEEVKAAFDKAVETMGEINQFVHFSKGMGSIDAELLEYIQSNLNTIKGTTTCTMTHKWMTAQSLGEIGNVIDEPVKFHDFLAERMMGVRQFEQQETYHLTAAE